MTNNDRALGIDYDGLPETEAFDRLCDRLDGVIVDARVARIGFDLVDVPKLNLHACLLF